MTRLQIIDDIIEGLSAYNVTDDSIFDRDYIGYKVDVMRETLIRNDYPVIDDKYYQSMCCIEVECLEQGCTIPGLGFIGSGDVIWKAELPSLMTDVGWKDIKFLGMPDYVSEFIRKTLSGWQSIKGLLYSTLEDIFYTIIGKDAYFKNLPTETKFICLIGLITQPASACSYDPDSDYPVPDVMRLIIAVKKDILSTYGIIPDVQQDSSGQPMENSMSGSKTQAAKGK